ncbi:E3 ubiquitin ligase TRAF3IP2 isoform X2 [Hypomesus transpacificus]|uniref:E3 ubiquitin ligase TRAF3IP2 isoform X2 n=1 Tax=Hypomesus transpacificus TaxID=137520 RepID=UPI001F0853B0|nr:E3 ubiquitin ligase TRAF3IP2 isoform X2 [Hypomesus transpacificus]
MEKYYFNSKLNVFCNSNKCAEVGGHNITSAVQANQLPRTCAYAVAGCYRAWEHHNPSIHTNKTVCMGPCAHREPPIPGQSAPPPQQLKQTEAQRRVMSHDNMPQLHREHPEDHVTGAGGKNRQVQQGRSWGNCVVGALGQAEPSGQPRQDTESVGQQHGDMEVDLDPPLPLRSDVGYQYHLQPYCSTPYHHSDPYGCHTIDARLYPPAAGGWREAEEQVYNYPPHHCPWPTPYPHNRGQPGPQAWVPQLQGNSESYGLLRSSYSINMPQYSTPPVEGVFQVSVKNLAAQEESSPSGGAAGGMSDPLEKRRTISLPDECRNIFVTYSEDASSEMVPFVEYLTNQGFRSEIDIFDNPIRRMDINKWMDSYLKDQSVIIIIAISPKYKAHTEGSGVDRHGLHTKYIYSMVSLLGLSHRCRMSLFNKEA